MSTDTVELLDQLNAVCKRFHVNDPHASEKDRFFAEAVALHEYQLKKAHEQGLKRADVPPGAVERGGVLSALTLAEDKVA